MGGSPSKLEDVKCSVALQDTEPEGESAIRRHFEFKDGLQHLPFPEEPSINTPFALFVRSVEKHAEKEFLGTRMVLDSGERGPYVFETYSQIGEKVCQYGAGLKSLGYESGAHISIFSLNRSEWTTMLLAIWSQDLTCVPLYDTLGAESVDFIMNHAEISCVCVNRVNLPKIMANPAAFKDLKHVIMFDPFAAEEQEALAKHDISLLSLQDLAQKGAESPSEYAIPEPEHLAYVMYTSGTTGNPKGVMLTHTNLLASTSGLLYSNTVMAGEAHLSYLPLAHSFETCLQLVTMAVGAKIGFYQGNIRKLTDDILTLRPTFMAGVPRVYSRIYDRVMNTIEGSGWFKKSLFEKAFKSQLEHVQRGDRSAFWDSLVFNKVKQRLGGRVRLMATGAAPMPKHVHEFLQVCFGCPVLQGYGMTENAAAACACPPGYIGIGSVGGPLPCTEVKLVDVPEMNYTSKDELPRGEIWLRGANVFKGYFKDEEKTKETKTEDGWLLTGDIGRWNADGSLSIIDRKKNIFKLAQGEFVAAEECESIISKASTVGQVWVYGNSFKSCIVAIVVPDVAVLVPWAEANGITGTTQEICANAAVKEHVQSEIKSTCKQAKLAGFKIPKDIYLEGDIDDEGNGFNVANNTLTPTFKLRRPQLLERYKEPIDAMYTGLGEITQSDQ